jgi:hypothetical protein
MKEYAQAEGVLAGFGVDSELVSDLSCGIGVSEMVECWEKVQHTSGRLHVDLRTRQEWDSHAPDAC